jgi:CBS domain-containing protein
MSKNPTSASPISEVMQSGVASVSPELTLPAFQEFLTAEEISGAPVLDQNGGLRGIASKTDIVAYLTDDSTLINEDALGDVTVEDIMTKDPIAVAADESVGEVARKMVEAGVHRVLVVEEEQIRGIVTSLDLLRALY